MSPNNMNIKAAILEEHTKAQSEIIAAYIGSRADRFGELMDVVLGEDEPAARRGAWVMRYCCEAHPEFALPYLPRLFGVISEKNVPSAIKRSTVRSLQFVPLPPNLTGPIFNLCYDFLNDPDETAAVRIYSITVLSRICAGEPALADEIILLLRQHLPHGSAGFKSRARKTLKALEKIRKN